MKKILLDGDIAVIDGKEFTTEQNKNFFNRTNSSEKQLETVKSIQGGVSSE